MAGPLRNKRSERLDSDALIADQTAYYRARAAEYDENLRALGRYVRVEGTVVGNEEGAEIRMVLDALERLQPIDRVLELACGTGWWTQWLASHARQVTAVDAAEEMLAINAIRVRSPNVRRILADVFSWKPDRQFDLVFFGFWLSHVPQGRFAAFWKLVGDALAPGGQVFFVDELDTELNRGSETRIAEDAVLRDLEDGRQFRAVKVFYEPSELELKLRQLGWRSRSILPVVASTGASRSPSRRQRNPPSVRPFPITKGMKLLDFGRQKGLQLWASWGSIAVTLTRLAV